MKRPFRWRATLATSVGLLVCLAVTFLDAGQCLREGPFGAVGLLARLPWLLVFIMLSQFIGCDLWYPWLNLGIAVLLLMLNAYVVIRPAIVCDCRRQRRLIETTGESLVTSLGSR